MNSPSAIDDATASQCAAGKEHRRSRRRACEGSAEVLVYHPECLFRGEIRDISQTGCFIATRAHVHLECQSEAIIRFRLKGRLFKTQVRLINIRPDNGVGFEFLSVNAQTSEQITNLIQELSLAAPDKPD